MMESTPKVSVCIPTHDRAHRIRGAIDSVLMQDFKDFELIISDDASMDDTQRVVAAYSDSRILYSRNSINLGLVGNFNRCLEFARGEYFMILGSDDRFAQGILRKEVEILDSYPSMAFVHTAAFPGESGIETRNRNRWPRIVPGFLFFEGFFLGKGTYLLSSLMARRDLVLKAGGFDKGLPANTDGAVWLRMALDGEVGYLDECLAGGGFRGDETISAEFIRTGKVFDEQLKLLRMSFSWSRTSELGLTSLYSRAIRVQARSGVYTFHLARIAGVNRSGILSLAGRVVRLYWPILFYPTFWVRLTLTLVFSPSVLSRIVAKISGFRRSYLSRTPRVLNGEG